MSHMHPPQPLPELPLEVQYLILESSDWLQQSILRHVCKSWQHYIDTSDTLLDDCYKASVQEESERNTFAQKPKFHNVVAYRTGFVKTPTGFTPCIFHRNNAGEVVDWSPEADLTIYLSDPLLKPGTELYIDGMDVYAENSDSDSNNGRTRFYGILSTCDHGSVASYLRDTCEGMDIVGGALKEGKYFKVSLSLGKTEAGDIRLKLLIEPEREAGTDEQAGALISQLSISQS
ncbi:hypothetical protein TWF569_002449 [Orbilia oligospora]|uniref:F-box domain-containing protein n=1 Tax=Orbilia oligospora TaxID=2813651 RepID=A0A7C8J6M1_ORBOL|nr:hypothetical protein TWF103_005158 [Orbilia oligospora]KAF3088967.1 hypothetical protein TWF706_010529 [Orbilia oligospora]KAF3088968.1 hypothetical protein TWF706_010529 [Orbilia oligospora]KAF3092860.1 hypothetical protein TWF102_008350 [Orbilia oligospora]KAF3121927.1 hypothetical protein TWF569_002449 [Orbilia oligospora]